MKKVKDPNRLRFKDYFGTTTMCMTEGITVALVGSWFMQYLTDYAGIGSWGAILGSALLMFARLFDAINDPLEGWIMDRAKVGKHGKYKPFIFLSILLSAIGTICLFFIPEGISDSPVMICIWVIFFYLVYDIGASFFAPNLVYRTLTLDPNARGKLVIGPRMMGMILGVVSGSLITIVNAVNGGIGNMHTAFGLSVMIMTGIMVIISLFGLLFVKEKYHAKAEKDEQVKITDIFQVLKNNTAQRTVSFSRLFSGFIWTFLFATMNYYIKWAYCADLTTGVVDTAAYGTLSMIGSMLMLLPLLIGTVIATPLLKLCKSSIKLTQILKLVQGAVGGAMFLLHITGILPNSPVLLFSLMAVSATCIGVEYIPQEVISIECMDYELYTSGKDRAALCNAVNKFLDKAQNAFASGIVGVVLVSIGYTVDSATDTYMGELAALPSLLTWFIVIMGLIPCFLGVISCLILTKYPITDEIREKMREKLTK